MNNLTLTLECPELTAAILRLSEAMKGAAASDVTAEALSQPPVPPATPTSPAAPVTAVIPQVPSQQTYTVPTTPAAPVTQPPIAVPTAAPAYTLDLLAPAAARMVEAGKQDQIVALLAKFGVQALTQLPAEQYGAFATELRQLGAQI